MCPLSSLKLKMEGGAEKRTPQPRGLKKTGPVLFSYGFRPFFLGGGLFAALAMGLWLATLASIVEPGGSYASSHWHAHEMLFGFGSAILTGFLLTAIPNWTGRLPVSGLPLMLLFTVWIAGRLVMLDPDRLGLLPSIMIDSAFLPLMLVIAAAEIVAGKKWKDLKILAGMAALSLANLDFHWAMYTGDHPGTAIRLSISAYTLLVMIIGGRIVPSFTRNFMAKLGRTDAPAPFGRFDALAILLGAAALISWTYDPEFIGTSLLATLATGIHVIRLMRWKGIAVWREKLLFVLHASYLFVAAGFAAIALGAEGRLDETTVLHVLTIGAISTMMLSVMTRATRGHTGRALTASRITRLSYVLLFIAAILRPLADILADWQMPLLYAAGTCFAAAFVLFGVEHFPMLARTRRGAIGG